MPDSVPGFVTKIRSKSGFWSDFDTKIGSKSGLRPDFDGIWVSKSDQNPDFDRILVSKSGTESGTFFSGMQNSTLEYQGSSVFVFGSRFLFGQFDFDSSSASL